MRTSSLHIVRIVIFETDVIKRDAHVSLLWCIFGYRDGKEEGKGDQGCSKTVVRYSMGNRAVTIFSAPPPLQLYG